MNLLNPWMLLGLAGLAGPFVLHLINRHRYPVEDFPAIQLLRVERRANRLARRLVDVPQLLLRLLVLLLLVLAMVRLFVPGVPGRAPQAVVVVVDCASRLSATPGRATEPGAASHFERAQTLARELLDAIPPPGLGALVAAGETVNVVRPLMRGSDAAKGVDELVLHDGAGAGLAAAVATAAGLLENRREPRVRIVVLSDLNATAFERRSPADLARLRELAAQLGDRFELTLVDLADGAAIENVALLEAGVQGGEVLLGDDARVRVRLLDRRSPPTGPDASLSSLRLRLGLPGVRDPFVRTVEIEPGMETVVELAGRVTRAVRGFGTVSIEADDDLPLDDRQRMPLIVGDARHVLIVREPPAGTVDAGEATAYAGPDGPTVLRYVLNPGRETGGAFSTGIESQVVTPEALGAQPLGRYSAVILYGVSTLPEAVMRDLHAFVRDGRALLLIAGEGVNPLLFNRSLTTARAAGAHALLSFPVGPMRQPEKPIGLDPTFLAHPVLAGLDETVRGELDMVRFARYRSLPAADPAGEGTAARAILRAADGAALLVESTIGRGRVLTLLFGMEAEDGNLVRTRLFPHLVWRLLDYATGRLDAPVAERMLAGRPAILDVSEPAFAFLEELEVSRQPPAVGEDGLAEAPAMAEFKPRRYPIRADRTLALPPLPVGEYLLHRPRLPDDPDALPAYVRPLAVNPDTAYASAETVTPDRLREWFGPAAVVADATMVDLAGPRGAEVWSLLLVLGVLAYLAEGLLAHRAGVRRAAQPGTREEPA